jgi:hypothetical protein
LNHAAARSEIKKTSHRAQGAEARAGKVAQDADAADR